MALKTLYQSGALPITAAPVKTVLSHQFDIKVSEIRVLFYNKFEPRHSAKTA